jgi:hypothetical protein
MNNKVDNDTGSIETARNEELKKGWRNVLERAGNWMALEDKDKWLDQMRGNLSLVATVIATMTFQMALNPPGGVRPIKEDANPPSVIKEDSDIPQCSNIADTIGCTLSGSGLHLYPGEAVLAVVYPHDYMNLSWKLNICWLRCNTFHVYLMSGVLIYMIV